MIKCNATPNREEFSKLKIIGTNKPFILSNSKELHDIKLAQTIDKYNNLKQASTEKKNNEILRNSLNEKSKIFRSSIPNIMTNKNSENENANMNCNLNKNYNTSKNANSINLRSKSVIKSEFNTFDKLENNVNVGKLSQYSSNFLSKDKDKIKDDKVSVLPSNIIIKKESVNSGNKKN